MLTVNELFAGIGSQSAALERLGVDYRVVGIAEIDKYAIKSYEAIHGNVRNYGDISKIEKLDYADFWTYSFPCQDISVAGKQRGINENTRSGLLYEVERLLYKSTMYGEQPKYLMLENVKNLVGKQFKPQFDEWIKRLDELGYNTYWKVLNAKNYGIPQNRERVFAISIRKDIDTGYKFPIGFDNEKRLRDILESEVEEKYYISDSKAEKLVLNLNKGKGASLTSDISGLNLNDSLAFSKDLLPNLSRCLKAEKHDSAVFIPCENNCIVSADLNHYGNDQMNRVYDINGISPTITVVSGGGREQKVLIPQAIKIGNTTPSGKSQCNDVYSIEGIHPTLCAGTHGNCNRSILEEPKFRIRKLTPLECWRLMGFADYQFYKAAEVNSNSQLYKQAGNSICVDVLYYLFKNLFLESEV